MHGDERKGAQMSGGTALSVRCNLARTWALSAHITDTAVSWLRNLRHGISEVPITPGRGTGHSSVLRIVSMLPGPVREALPFQKEGTVDKQG